MPGYCSELAEKLEPYNWTVSYNPEFIAQGTVIYNQRYPDQVLIGEANVEKGIGCSQFIPRWSKTPHRIAAWMF